METNTGKIRVMVVDDSAIVRQSLKELLEADPAIEVMATAQDPLIAQKKVAQDRPDVMILDIEMPRMDGLSYLRQIMTEDPLPVIICSSMAEKGSGNALQALELGAVEIIEKPKMGTRQFLEEARIQIIDKVKAVHASRRGAGGRLKTLPSRIPDPAPKLNADVMLPPTTGKLSIETTEKIVVVGASTGGTEALRTFIEALPIDCPGVVVVQHMPEHFTRSFAERLDKLSRVTVKEAAQNDTVLRGQVLIAPGNRHTLLKRSGARYFVEVKEGPLVCRHRPSVDVLFRSAARYGGPNVVAVIMTGMGDDGARGMKELKEAGAHTLAQNEETCVVFGMPNEAIKLGGVDQVLPLESLAQAVLAQAGKNGK